MKKLTSLLLCLTLVLSLALPVFATEAEGSGESESGSSTEAPPETSHTHSWDGGTVTTAATCTADGVKTYTCACGTTATEVIAATGHSFGSWTQTESTHERTCPTCNTTEGGSHAMSSQVTTAATCVAAGVETHSCGTCGYSYTKEIPVSTTHTYGEWDGDETSHFRTCTLCSAKDSGAHKWADEVVSVAPTCKDEGVVAQICTVCGGALYEVLPKLTTHTYDNACDSECNVCGLTREIEHKFSAAWTRNWKEHWHECTICKEKTGIGDHYPGPAATEEKDQLCLTCGLVMTPKLNHQHDYSAQWSADETGHWYACDGCEDQKDFAYHEYDDLCDPDCNICSFQSPTAHSFDENWSSDETGHWTVCVLCGEEKAVEAHTADPDAPATEAVLCTLCGYEMAPAPEHVHEAAENWRSDEQDHWKTCECGEKLDKAPHSWDAGTENEDTTITYRCTVCGEVRTEGEPKEPSSFPAGLVFVLLAVAAVSLVAALIFLLRPGKKQTGKYHKK